jgi:NitT/TauT family transport system permease protein
MSAVTAIPSIQVPRRRSVFRRVAESRFFAVSTVVVAIIVIWYAGAILLDAPFQRDLDQRRGATVSTMTFIAETLNQKKPTLPSPHQVAVETYKSTVLANPTKPSSLLFHAWVTLYSTLVGFVSGTLFGILLAVGIVHVKSLDKSLMPWIISSQTIPILAIAPMVIVVLAAVGITGLIPKALISTYLSFFPVTVGMVKGLRSPAPINLDLMRTYHASRWQVLWKLRLPASLPFLFTSMKVAVAAALVGAIVAELPTGAVAGIGAKLLVGSYYSQSVQMWAALVVGSLLAALLVVAVGITERLVMRRMGARAA